MRTSETTGELSAALAKAQGLMRDPPTNGVNPHFRSRFATLADTLPIIRKALAVNGLHFAQAVDVEARSLVTWVGHASGEWMQAGYPLPIQADPQKQGSALTYARRYALFALFGLVGDPDADDDGEAVAGTAAGERPAGSHHPEWKAGRAAFCAALRDRGVSYDQAAAHGERQGWGRPSAWPQAQRQRYLERLETDPDFAAAARGGEA